MKCIKVFTCLAGLLSVVSIGSTAGAQLSIDRGELNVQPTGNNGERVGVLTVRNDGAARAQGSVILEDWDRDSLGGNRFHKSGSMPHSCGSAIKVFPAAFALQPGQSQSVRIEYDGGERTTECTSLVVVEEVKPEAAIKSNISVKTRMGLKVYVTPAAASAEGEVSDVDVVTDSKNATTSVRVNFENTGDRHLQAKGHLEIRRLDNSVAAVADLPTVYALAKATMSVSAKMPELAAGRYVLLVVYDYGGAELAAGQIEYEVASK